MATPPTTEPLFTAAQIAAAVGARRQHIVRKLARVSASGSRLVAGNEAKAWALAALPIDLQQRLASIAEAKGCRNAIHLITGNTSTPCESITLRDLHDDDLAQARQLRAALERALSCRSNPLLDGSGLEQMGVADYQKEFGRPISARHWRRLFQRVLERAGAAPDFSRLEHYLPEAPRKKAPTGQAEGADDEGLAAIRRQVRAFSDPSKPSKQERELIWRLSAQWYHEQTGSGLSERKAKEQLFGFLLEEVPSLARSRDALRKCFDNRLKDPAKHTDGRTLANAKRRKKFEAEEIDRLVWLSLQNYRGRVAPALRELPGEEPELMSRPDIRFSTSAKSYVPKRLGEEVARRVEAVAPFFKGPRAADAATPSLDLSYAGIASMDCVVLDDFTFNILGYIDQPDGRFKLSRFQVILAIDFRTLRILGWALMPEEQPNSLAARTVCARVFRDHGIPKLLYLEQGRVFKESLLMTGGNRARSRRFPGWEEVSNADVEVGLRQFGLEIIHARRARSKPIERVGDLVQSLMDGCQGWVGRNERLERPEAITRQMYEVETGKVHPAKYFLSYQELDHYFDEVFRKYNAIVQQGKRLPDISPEALFEQLWPHDDPPVKFDPRCEFLLAHHRSLREIKGGAITFQVRGESYCYRDVEALSPNEGQSVLAHWNPERPESLTITDKHLRNPVTIARCEKPHALARLVPGADAVLGRETAKVRGHMKHWQTYYHSLETRFKQTFRSNMVAPRVEKLGASIQQERKRLDAERRAAQAGDRKRRSIAAATGRRVEELPRDADEFDDLLRSGIRELEQQVRKDQS